MLLNLDLEGNKRSESEQKADRAKNDSGTRVNQGRFSIKR